MKVPNTALTRHDSFSRKGQQKSLQVPLCRYEQSFSLFIFFSLNQINLKDSNSSSLLSELGKIHVS